MSIVEKSIQKRTLAVFSCGLFLLWGLVAATGLGQLEDPEFTVKVASIATRYPGASAEEVELEVTDRIEQAVQKMPQLKEVTSFSRAGFSSIKATIKSSYTSDVLPQIWDELRKRVSDVEPSFPPGVQKPTVIDDFGDVYGFFFAVVADSFTMAELERYVDHIRKELSLIPGVKRVEPWGVQQECVYIDVSQSRLSQLGLSMADVQMTLQQQNLVVDSGGIDITDQRLRFQTTGEFTSPEEILDLVIRGRSSPLDQDVSRLIRVRDIGEGSRGYVEPRQSLMRFDGRPAIGLSIANVSGANIVDLGKSIDARLQDLFAELPVGVELGPISWQSEYVASSIRDFVINLLEAVAIVLAVLWLAMGFRTSVVVGLTGLVFVIVLTFLVMSFMSVDLQRMSLGALVIAMGMMVDNAIVVADGVLVRVQKGMDPTKAAIEAASQPAMPLLGATIIAVLAFYPIAASEESAGEYCATLFSVVAISLMISWLLSVTLAPLMCAAMLKAPKSTGGPAADPYASVMYRMFRGILRGVIRARYATVLIFVGMLVAAGIGFGSVDRTFFPSSARPQMMVDIWLPEGTRLNETSAQASKLESFLMDQEGVVSVSAFVGKGPARFYLPVEPESPYSSYAHLVINTPDAATVDRLIEVIGEWASTNAPGAQIIPRRFGLGPSKTWQVEARFSGPAIADPRVLRDLANEATAIMESSPHTLIARTDWRERSAKLVAQFDQANARWTGVSRADVADTLRRAFDGLPIGQYREDDKLLPIILRHGEEDRAAAASNLDTLQVRTAFSRDSYPLAQVTRGIDVEWEDPLIWRFNRRRAITVQVVPVKLADSVLTEVRPKIEAIPLPPGYELMWDGEYRSARDSQASLIPGLIPAALLMALIIVALFNAYRPSIIIVSVIPFAMIGVTIGLLLTGQPFGFVALLGAMSLAGMMVKNAIVLLDEINAQKSQGASDYDAVIDATMSRLRPVMLAAGTTVLGVMPLLQDVFWISMSVTIMFGLSFGTLVTMLLIPALYAILFRVKST